MHAINELIAILTPYLAWNKSRLTCLASMVISLIKVRHINLVELAIAFEGKAKIASRHKRIQRFLNAFTFDFSLIARWVIMLFQPPFEGSYLSLDRTNWCWGKSNINILMLSICYKGIALPLLWSVLPKTGNSHTRERITLLERLMPLLGKIKVAGLLADREFIGQEWFSWLIRQRIPFCIRIKENTLVRNRQGKVVNVKQLFHDLKPGEQHVLTQRRMIWKLPLYLSALGLQNGERLILVSDKRLENPMAVYGKRWEIETLFSCLKTRGFNFEDTHITEPKRIEKLITILTIAFCWSHKVGEWRHEKKAIVMKKHGRLAQSIFRYGLDYLRDYLLNVSQQTTRRIGIIFEAMRLNLPINKAPT